MRDVRMRGFAERADVEEVQAFLAKTVARLGSEPVDLLDCVGRVLAAEVSSEFDVPGFARAAMDGYAIRGEDSFGASAYDPLRLDLIGESLPGRPFNGRVRAGQAVRIMTGAPIPEGADAVVMAEVCEETEGGVELRDAVAPRKNVGATGEDIRAGALVLPAGRRLRPQDGGLLASIGVSSVACVRRPRVQLLITGDELLPPGSRPEGAKRILREISEGTELGRAIGDGAVATGKYMGHHRVPESRGQAIPAWDPRPLKATGVTYCTSAMGADHTAGLVVKPGLPVEEMAWESQKVQIVNAVCDSSGFCQFLTPCMDDIREFYGDLYGDDVSREQIADIGWQCLSDEWEFNDGAGFTDADDKLADCLQEDAIGNPPTVFDVPREIIRAAKQRMPAREDLFGSKASG